MAFSGNPPPSLRAARVLVADDDLISRKRLESLLRKRGYEVTSATDGLEALAVLEAIDSPSIAILDWMMPGFDGPEICRKLRTANREPYVYVILVTGKDSKDDLIAGLDAGADDYLTKPFHAQELEVRLRSGARIVELQCELISTRERLRYQASHDILTGVFNRAALTESLDRELARSRRAGDPLSVLMVDLDFFKRVNDTCGHAAGDAVLREACVRFKGALRAYDILGRFGGEEFVVVLPSCEAEGALRSAERLRAALADSPMRVGEHTVAVTCSVGVGVGSRPREVDAAGLLASADAAVYEAKRLGRDRVVLGLPPKAQDSLPPPSIKVC